ncbi:hypothetical protein [Pantoea phage LIMElight]|uniref:Uncharacterized protein n=1 Tax=Pantoea phage LIMElight TaxID=881915 RepID=E1Y3W4_9CAUD|nr:hypothetical protein F370_gp15 [Pantoea phage LIMElight]CBW54773.1 hypothetical protein [Pantoea phage LIMElight]
MWLKAKDLQDMIEDAKRAGRLEGEIAGRRIGYAEGEESANRSMRSAERAEHMKLPAWAGLGLRTYRGVECDRRRLVSVSFEYKGNRTTFGVNDLVGKITCAIRDNRLVVTGIQIR